MTIEVSEALSTGKVNRDLFYIVEGYIRKYLMTIHGTCCYVNVNCDDYDEFDHANYTKEQIVEVLWDLLRKMELVNIAKIETSSKVFDVLAKLSVAELL